MIELTSVNNDIVKEVVAISKGIKDSDFIILEGEKAIQGAIDNRISLEKIFFEDEKYLKPAKAQYKVNSKILEKISSTKSKAPAVALCYAPKYDIEEFKNYKKIALFENIKDAGNLGTIIRSASAFSIDGIILYGDCVRPYSTKVIRSSVGTIFKTPIIHIKNGLEKFKKTHKFYGTVVKDGEELKIEEPAIILFGSEADGLSGEILNLVDKKYTLKMADNVESLNLGICASIVFYKVFNKI